MIVSVFAYFKKNLFFARFVIMPISLYWLKTVQLRTAIFIYCVRSDDCAFMSRKLLRL
jgi:hypothetical protein